MTRQIKTSDQLNIEENHPNYWVVQDPQIPIEPKQNIVLKPNGLQIIARHYHQKYGITILAHQEYIKISALAEKIHAIILKLKTDSPALSKVGLIFISNDDPDDIFGHALPMIWEKDGEYEHLFFLDTMQLLGETDSTKIKLDVNIFRQNLLRLMPNLRLWSMYGHRQVDYSSCFTDALVVLKDGLLQTSFSALVKNRIKLTESEVTIFFAPEILLRTTQVISLISKSNTNPKCVIHKQQTLDDWARKYNSDITVKGLPKKFGTFTLFKAKKYAKKLTLSAEEDKKPGKTS